MWFLMDLPLNAHRIALIRTPTYISTQTLHNLTCFFLKTDMRFTDPVRPPYPTNHSNQLRHPNKHAGGCPTGVKLRKMLLAERQLTSLWRVLRGWTWETNAPRVPMTRLDVLRLWIRHRYVHPEGTSETVRRQSIMGIPWWEIGTAGFERTGVSFLNLTEEDEEKQVPILHPSIAGAGLSAHQHDQLQQKQKETFYPHAKHLILPPFLEEKPREPLLRPDELVLKECVRRRLGMHRKWVFLMLYGFSDEAGWNFPVFTEGEMLRMGRGLPPREGMKMKKDGVEAGGGEGKGKGKTADGDGGKEESEKGLWSTLPKKRSN